MPSSQGRRKKFSLCESKSKAWTLFKSVDKISINAKGKLSVEELLK